MNIRISGKLSVSILLLPAVAAFLAFFPLPYFLSFLLAAAVHECGHLLVLRLFRVRPVGILLMPGGVVISAPVGSMTYPAEFLLSVAGPAANFLLLVAVFYIVPSVPFWADTARSCLLLALFNLLPAARTDGGRALFCLLLQAMPLHAARFISRALSLATGLCIWLLGGFLFFRAVREVPESGFPAATLFFFGLVLFLDATADK